MSSHSDDKIDKFDGGEAIDSVANQAYDAEKHTTTGELNAFDQKAGEELHRSMKARHIAMISIGGEAIN